MTTSWAPVWTGLPTGRFFLTWGPHVDCVYLFPPFTRRGSDHSSVLPRAARIGSSRSESQSHNSHPSQHAGTSAGCLPHTPRSPHPPPTRYHITPHLPRGVVTIEVPLQFPKAGDESLGSQHGNSTPPGGGQRDGKVQVFILVVAAEASQAKTT